MFSWLKRRIPIEILVLSDTSELLSVWGYFGLAKRSVRFAIEFKGNCPGNAGRLKYLREMLADRRRLLVSHSLAARNLERDVSLLERAVAISTIGT